MHLGPCNAWHDCERVFQLQVDEVLRDRESSQSNITMTRTADTMRVLHATDRYGT